MALLTSNLQLVRHPLLFVERCGEPCHRHPHAVHDVSLTLGLGDAIQKQSYSKLCGTLLAWFSIFRRALFSRRWWWFVVAGSGGGCVVVRRRRVGKTLEKFPRGPVRERSDLSGTTRYLGGQLSPRNTSVRFGQ